MKVDVVMFKLHAWR